MLARAIHFILTRTALGQWLDGKKSAISACLLALAAVLELLEKLVVLFPEYVPLATGAKELAEFLDAAVTTLTGVGFGGLVVGLSHKGAKAKIANDADK